MAKLERAWRRAAFRSVRRCSPPTVCCSAVAATDEFKTMTRRCMPKPTRSVPPAANATTVPRTEYTAAMRRVADDLLALFAYALGLPDNPFVSLADRPTWTMNINHYPPVSVVGEPEPGQFRIGPHTDFGTVTILDREPGAGGLQVYSDADGWADAPYDPEALTVNIGDLLEYWSGRRWPSGRHRVLPPQPHAPGAGRRAGTGCRHRNRTPPRKTWSR
jgi:isopenicillin N synthase-like dioxygenase